jgi:hypothetical protein
VNAQIEFMLRDSLARRGIKPPAKPSDKPRHGGEGSED